MSDRPGESARPRLGEYLRDQRVQQGLNQTEVGTRIGLSMSSISEFERFAYKLDPTVSRFLAICKGYNVSPIDVLVEVYGVPTEHTTDQEALEIGRKVLFLDPVSRDLTIQWIDQQIAFQGVDPSQPPSED